MSWYNTCRPHSKLGVLTPEEAFRGKVLHATTEEFIPARRNARDGPNIQIDIARRHYRLDPHLPMIEIKLRKAA
jgi:hypothetical protein